MWILSQTGRLWNTDKFESITIVDYRKDLYTIEATANDNSMTAVLFATTSKHVARGALNKILTSFENRQPAIRL